MAFGIRNFWQSFPGQLDIRNAASDNAEVTAWLWSPECPPDGYAAVSRRHGHDHLRKAE